MRSTTSPRSGPSVRTERWATRFFGRGCGSSCSPRTVMMTSLMAETLRAGAADQSLAGAEMPSVTVYNGCCGAAISASLQRFASLRSLERLVGGSPRRVSAMSEVTITVRGEHEDPRPARRSGRAPLRPHRRPRTRRRRRAHRRARRSAARRPRRRGRMPAALTDWSSQRVSVWAEPPVEQRGQAARPRALCLGRDHRDLHRLRRPLMVDQRRRRARRRAGRQRDLAAHPRHGEVHGGRCRCAGRESRCRPRHRLRLGDRPRTLTPLEIADLGLLTDASHGPAPAPKMMRAMAMGAMDAGRGARRRAAARRHRRHGSRRGALLRTLIRALLDSRLPSTETLTPRAPASPSACRA